LTLPEIEPPSTSPPPPPPPLSQNNKRSQSPLANTTDIDVDHKTTSSDAQPSKKFRYVGEPVRKRDERAKLKGRECEQCRAFYDAICVATGRAPPPDDGNHHHHQHQHQHDADDDNGNAARQALIGAVSRHRDVCTPPPSTPKGFWDVDFSEAAVRSDESTQGATQASQQSM
jgi:hypothetical protein